MADEVIATRPLSSSQLETLREHGEEHTAEAGETLYDIGDESYPFIALLEGEVAILDGAGHEIVRHGPSAFLGELNLLTGQAVFITARAETPVRYIAVDRDEFRELLYEYGPLSELVLNAFVERREALQNQEGIGIQIVGARSSPETRRLPTFARNLKVPYAQYEPGEGPSDGRHPTAGDGRLPYVRLPGGREMCNPSNGELSRALGIGAELAPREEVDLLILGAGPAGLGAAVYGSSEGLSTLVVEKTVVGGQAGSSRRIENYLGFPAGITGTELTSRAATQARKFGTRIASPYRAQALTPGDERHVVTLDGGNEVAARAVLLGTGAEYRKLPVDGLDRYEGITVFYAAGPLEGKLCAAQKVAVVGGGNSAGQAAVWLARGGALVTLLHRRSDLGETMSKYLIGELDRYGVEVRDRSEIAQLHGSDGQLKGVTLTDSEYLAFSYMFLFLGASPCTDWLGECIARDANGFILTGADAGAEGLLETSVPGVYAAGDVRAGSVKRCATAVAEGATVVALVHKHLAGLAVAARPQAAAAAS